MQVQSLGGEDLLEEGVGTHSSILAWRISWTEEPGGLQSMGHSELTHTHTHAAAVHCSTSACLFHLTDPLENTPYFFLIKTRPTALPSGRR